MRHDPNASTVVPAWQRPDEATRARLLGYWETASRNVAHLGWARVYGQGEPWRRDELAAIAGDVLDVWRSFVETMRSDPKDRYLNLVDYVSELPIPLTLSSK